MSRASKSGLAASGIPEVRTTQWHNPTEDVVSVILTDPGNRQFRFTIRPGETVALDSQYDRSIQLVDCGKPECHNRPAGGHYCNAGHPGLISGGLAPQLRRVGKTDTIEECLDQEKVKEKQLQEQLSVASRISSIQQGVAEDAALKLSKAQASKRGVEAARSPAKAARPQEAAGHQE